MGQSKIMLLQNRSRKKYEQWKVISFMYTTSQGQGNKCLSERKALGFQNRRQYFLLVGQQFLQSVLQDIPKFQ